MSQSLVLDSKKLEVITPKLPINLFRLQVVRLVSEYCKELKVKHRQIRIKPLCSRWGSCTRSGVITINLKLKDLPNELLAYVVYHECLHLFFHNHGPEFKFKLQAKFPNHKELNKQLKLFGTLLKKF